MIRNGSEDQDKETMVTSGVISLNGEVLFTHDDIKHQTYILEMPATLLKENTLRVELESKPGTFLTIEIIQNVPDPTVDLMASGLLIDSEHCPEYIDISLRMTNSGEEDISAGVQVAFYNRNPEEEGVLIGTATSGNALAAGEYETITFRWSDAFGDETVIYARVDDDGTGAGILDEADETDNLVSADATLCTLLPGDSSMSGRVIDGVTGDSLSGVQTALHVNDNGSPGAVVATAVTDVEGTFLFSNLAAGTYIISTGYEGYIDNQRTVTVAENEQLTNQDLVLSPVLAEGEIRIILTWGESPADLESHLTAPNETGCRHHCYYWNKNIPTANLDLDDRNGFGPETITITDAAAGTYRYYVHDFTNRNTYYTQWLARSGAEVKVYSGSNEPLVFTVPSGYGTGWHVFDLDGETGEIIPVNTLFRQSEPGRIDYPSITSSITYGYAYWGALYTYQVQAADPDDDTLTYSLTEAPDGMVIDPDTGMIEWTPFSTQSGWYYTTVKVEDGRCGEVTQRFRVYVYSQPTANFSVDPCSGVNPGGNITLTWSTTLAATVFIDQGIGEVPANGSLTIPSPEAPTLYTLTAFNDAALTKRTTPAVPWRSFYFSPASIPLGGSTTLYWNSPCSTDRSIDHEIGEVPVSGSVEVTPTTTGWSYYYLTATNAGGSNKYWARVYAYPPAPPTASIAVTPTCNLTPGEEKTLSWQTTNATEVTISPDIGSVESSGSRLIYPATSGIYTITATGLGGTVSRTVEYPNSPGLSFYSSTYYLDTGGSAILNWSAGCADTAILNQGIGEVPTVGSMEVSPETFPVTYTMIVENERSSYSRNVTLQQHLPSISFSASPSNTINPGDSVTLNWTVKYADTLTMNQGVGPVEASGSLTITPETLPLTYTLTSVNERGSAARSVTLYYTPPRGTLTAEPLQLKVGDSTTLTWTSTNAETCTITPDIGEVDCNGSMEVTPTSSPTYYLFEMVGSGGIYRRGVYVSFVAPTADLKTSAATVNEGESVELSWVFANATSCIIDQGIGEVEPGGVQTVTPPVTTTYTMTATGPGGTVTDQVTVTVIPANPTPTVNLTTNKIRIIRGDSVVLSWESSYADSLLIEPDVGTAALNGSATMTPEVTTTYTATAVNTDGTATDTVTVTVIPPSPTVNLTAEPTNIMAGESAVLTWTSFDADSIVFNQGIGEEQLQGSLTVSPTETTTYVATATGQGGTTSKSITVTVTYPEPTASLNADPASIGFGYSTTLSWTTQDAQDCTIEPNIGAVDCAAGEQSVYLLQDTTYTLTATGQGGTVTAQAVVTVVPSPMTLTITSPTEGAINTRSDILVTGTVTHENGLETGILVNGVTALVYGNQFVANHVPLSEEGTITVNAFDADGNRGLQSASVTVQPTTRQIELQSGFESGLAPMENTLKSSKNFIASSQPEITYSGPANMVAETDTEDDTWNISMTEPGIYIYSVEVRDENGETYTGQVAVLVNDRVTLDALLQGKWNGMKQALTAGDSAEALEEFTFGQRELFQEIFTAAESNLAQIALNMQDVELIYQKNDTAKYRIKKEMVINEATELITFYIYFQRERDGIWRIRDF